MRIVSHLSDIIQTVDRNPATILVAPTGVGKSTIVPGTLARLNLSRELTKKGVFVSVPTRTSARSLKLYMQKIFPQISIGSAAEGNVEYSNKTDLVYATSGHLHKKMLNAFIRAKDTGKDPVIDFCNTLIVDESHTGSIDNTVIISLWYYAYNKKYKVPKLILISATPTPMKLHPRPALYEVPVPQSYPVDIVYLESPSGNRAKGKQLPKDRDIMVQAEKTILSIVDDKGHRGDVLVFVAGSGDVENLIKKLNVAKVNEAAVVVGAYSAMKKEDMDLIYDDPPEGKFKIIIATNIAESSITIEGLTVVVDTLLEKRSGSTKSGGKRLTTEFISKDSAAQRKGRVGRTQAGKCYRLLTEEQYTSLDDHKLAEIERVPIHEVVMELMVANLNPIDVIKGIDISKVRSSITTLNKLGMIEQKQVTEMGRFSTRVPLNVNNASMLYRWIESGSALFPGVVVSGIIDSYGPSYFYIPRRERDQNASQYRSFITTYAAEVSEPHLGHTEVHTYINLWNDFAIELGKDIIEVIKHGRVPFKLVGKTKEWSNLNRVNWKKFSELILIISQTYNGCVRYLRDTKLENVTTIGLFDADKSMEKMGPLLAKSYPSSKVKNIGGSTYQNTSSGEVFSYDTRVPLSAMDREKFPPPELLTLNTFQFIDHSGRAKDIISLAIPFDASKMVEEPEVPKRATSSSEVPKYRHPRSSERVAGPSRPGSAASVPSPSGSSRSGSRTTRSGRGGNRGRGTLREESSRRYQSRR